MAAPRLPILALPSYWLGGRRRAESGGIVAAHFGKGGIILCDPNRAGENADPVFQEIYRKAI